LYLAKPTTKNREGLKLLAKVTICANGISKQEAPRGVAFVDVINSLDLFMANFQEGTHNISIYLHMWQVDRSMVYVYIYNMYDRCSLKPTH
jgi:uncharacterized protein YfbU (UPF0304 family)